MTPEEFAQDCAIRQVTRMGCPIITRKTKWQKVIDWIMEILTAIWMILISRREE